MASAINTAQDLVINDIREIDFNILSVNYNSALLATTDTSLNSSLTIKAKVSITYKEGYKISSHVNFINHEIDNNGLVSDLAKIKIAKMESPDVLKNIIADTSSEASQRHVLSISLTEENEQLADVINELDPNGYTSVGVGYDSNMSDAIVANDILNSLKLLLSFDSWVFRKGSIKIGNEIYQKSHLEQMYAMIINSAHDFVTKN